jgi:hypothetical protein
VLHLEPTPHQPLDTETREALISALADLLLEAYGVETPAAPAEQGAGHES